MFSCKHDADLPPQPGGIDLADIDAVDQDLAALDAIEPLDELRQSRLAGARSADDADDLAGRDVEIDVLEHVGRVHAVAEGEAADLDRAFGGRKIGVGETLRFRGRC